MLGNNLVSRGKESQVFGVYRQGEGLLGAEPDDLQQGSGEGLRGLRCFHCPSQQAEQEDRLISLTYLFNPSLSINRLRALNKVLGPVFLHRQDIAFATPLRACLG